ncbi:BON1-associated protein 2-like [Salvia miltiorrhiza]|uniref:BON1-associated protein 2-like n=1 Tax=Salvia miltiorrhiza TaxID=226208 RepID=UPI0025AD7277|nr:BON1-associated protein 2-like [Salvia miltiorrhiza]
MEKPPPMTIEVAVISAEGLLLSRGNKSVEKGAFVVVRSDPLNSRSTGTDREGGSCPAWNEKWAMELPADTRFLTVEAHSGSRPTSPSPISRAGFCPLINYSTFLTYRLRDANGRKNGILNLSVKVAACPGEPWAGVPVVDGKATCRGIATGIPI